MLPWLDMQNLRIVPARPSDRHADHGITAPPPPWTHLSNRHTASVCGPPGPSTSGS